MSAASQRRLKIVSRQVGGYALLLVGIAGCILPILPGIPFIFGGLAMLAVDSPWAARLLTYLKQRWQNLRHRNSDGATSIKEPS